MRVLLALLLFLVTGYPAPVQAAAAPASSICPRGYAQEQDGCRLQMPVNATAKPKGGWVCNWGFYADGDKCPRVVLPANAELAPSGRTWMCSEGFHEADNKCLPGPAPPPAATPIARSFCDWGFERVGNRCIPYPRPYHSRRITGTSDWICLPGYQDVGGTCIPILIPLHTRIATGGDEWLCARGYEHKAGKCVEIDVPNNASLGFFGDVWSCNRGYYEIRGVCLPETKEHMALTRTYTAAFVNGPSYAKGPPLQLFRRTGGSRGFLIALVVGILAGGALILTFRDPPPRITPNLRMSYVPRARGASQVSIVWRAFGHRIDALTGATVSSDVTMAQCRNCRAWYKAESVTALREENDARCVACGRAALSYNVA